jgi:hypothetical protein
MRVRDSSAVSGAGDLIFKTVMGIVHTNRGTRQSEVHYGFLGIEDVREVETLIHKVLLKTIDDDDDDDEKPRKKRRDEDDDDDEPKAKKKRRDDDDEDEDEKPRKKSKRRDDDDD